MADKCNVLMVYPRFNPKSFWSFEGVLHTVGARYPAAPLGLITVAAMLPSDWDVRLINRNTEDLTESDLAWADMVMTGGMFAQQPDTHEVIGICRSRNIPVVVGGPDVTSSPHVYSDADFRVVGEAEDVLSAFIAAWTRGERQGCFEAPKFQADVRKTPIPRFDLLKFSHYLYIGVQFSRGCPFTCEFCDIIELYGRVPRTKSPPQMLAELDALYALGYRGHVDFVDDNLIGNKKAVKEFLPHLVAWQKAHKYPFMLSTEASINLSDDAQLLQLLRDANFFAIFVGIESPDTDTLIHMSKKQNTRRSIAESVRRINAFGIFVFAGFVIGFDSEKGRIASKIIQCIEDCGIPVAMVGRLKAYPNTELTRRLQREARLFPGLGVDSKHESGGLCVDGLNFETARPRVDILRDHMEVLSTVYSADTFFERVRRTVIPLPRPGFGLAVFARDAWRDRHRLLGILREVTLHRPAIRGRVWRLLAKCLVRNPRALHVLFYTVVFFLYLEPLTAYTVRETEKQIDDVETGRWKSPLALPEIRTESMLDSDKVAAVELEEAVASPFPNQRLRPFTRDGVEALAPGQTGVYGLYRNDAWVYVGRGDIRARLLSHLNENDPDITREKPTHFVTRVTSDDEAVEKALIIELQPLANTKRVG